MGRDPIPGTVTLGTSEKPEKRGVFWGLGGVKIDNFGKTRFFDKILQKSPSENRLFAFLHENGPKHRGVGSKTGFFGVFIDF